MLTVSMRTFRRRITISCPDEPVRAILNYCASTPDVRLEPAEDVRLNVEKADGFFRMALPKGYVAEGSGHYLVDLLHRLHFQWTQSEFPMSPIIHAGLIATAAGHVLLVGSKGAGKSTLLTRLLADGYPVAGDEHVVIVGGTAIARPRTLRVKSGTLDFLSEETVRLICAQPSMEDWQKERIYAVSPSLFGGAWSITQQPVRHVVIMQANHGGLSRLTRYRQDVAFSQILQNVLLVTQHRAHALAWVHSLTKSVPCWDLRNGRLDDTLAALKSLCD